MEPSTPPPGPLGPAPREERIGPYHVLGELGRGGQCIVFLAEDSRLPRRVALKVLPRGVDHGGAEIRRFKREAEVAARLDHPGICPALETGESDGIAWIAMRFVEGETLARRIDTLRGGARPGVTGWLFKERDDAAAHAPTRRPPSTKEDLDAYLLLFERVARALHAAHEAGLVHRDVKPGNIMLTPSGEPVLLDFGVAREMSTDHATLTKTGAVLGTPAYLPPEALRRDETGSADRRSDIWSLGVTIYETFTLALPFDAPTLDRLFHRILLSDPEDLLRTNPALPRDLRTVLETAMEKDPARRYQTALALADELGRVRRHEEIHARPSGPLTRTLRWAERNPALAASLGATFLALAGGLGTSLHFLAGRGVALEQKESALGAAEKAREKTEAALAETREALRRNRALALAAASSAAQGDDPVRAVLLAREGWRTAATPETELRLREAIRVSYERARIDFHGRRVQAAAWSPSGDRIATGGDDNLVRIGDAAGREVAVLRGHREDVFAIAWSADGASLRSASRDGTVRLWGADGAARESMDLPAARTGPLAFGPEGAIAVGDASGRVRTLRADGAPVAEAAVHRDAVTAIRFGPGGDLVTASKDGTAAILGPDLAVRRVLKGHEGAVTDAALAADGSAATASEDRTARLWGPDGTPGPVLRAHGAPVVTVDIDPAGTRVLTGSRDGTARLWDRTGRERAVLRGHRGPVVRAALSPVGAAVATGSEDGSARLWDPSEPEFTDLRDPAGPVRKAWFAAGGRVVTVVNDPRVVIRTWDEQGRPVHETRIVGAWQVLWSSREGDRMLVGVQDRFYVRLLDGEGQELRVQKGWMFATHPVPGTESILLPDEWNLALLDARRNEVRTFPRCPVFTRAAAGTKDLKRIGIVGDDGSVHLLDGDGNVVRLLHGPGPRKTGDGLYAAFSPDGSRFLADSPERDLRLIDCESGRLLETLPRRGERIDTLVFHPKDSSLLLMVWQDGTGEIRREGRGAIASFGPPAGPRVLNAAWSPDGESVAIACVDDGARILGLDGAVRMTLDGLGGPVNSVKFSADGSRLLAVAGGEAHIRSLRPLDLEALTAVRVTRDLTVDERRAHEGILGEENRVELAAAAVVDGLRRVNPDPGEVLAAIEADASLAPEVREAALRQARLIPLDPIRLNSLAWNSVVVGGRQPKRLLDALRWGRRAAELEPESGPILNTLGVCEFRNGLLDEAYATLVRSDALNRVGAPGGSPADSLFLALVEHARGRDAEARRWYAEARGQLEDPRQAEVQFGILLREVEAALGVGGAPPR